MYNNLWSWLFTFQTQTRFLYNSLTARWCGQRIQSWGFSFAVWQIHIFHLWFSMSFSDMPIESAFGSKCFFTIFAFKNQSMKFIAMHTFFKLWLENLVTYLAGDHWSFVFSYVVFVETLLVKKIDLADFATHLIFKQYPQTIITTHS